jgi:hypothetical protein
MRNKTKGYLLHAFGYTDLNYARLAICCALSIKTHLLINNITLVTDAATCDYLLNSFGKEFTSQLFDEIIIAKEKYISEKRKHANTPWNAFSAPFNNHHRALSYQYTPYDETILMDVDYIVMSPYLDSVWGNTEDLLINYKAIDLQHNIFGGIDDQRLGKYGIDMFFATLVYFKKSDFSKTFFDLITYIKDEYQFFQFLYGFKKGVYRNDFSYSIAAHIISGFSSGGIRSFPNDTILTSYQQDSIAEIVTKDKFIFMATDMKEMWKTTLVNISDMDVHIMNKQDFIVKSGKYIELCKEAL